MKELKQQLLKKLGEPVSKHGYSKKPKGQDLLRNLDGIRHCLHLSFIDHQIDLDVTVYFAVRFNEVEELVNFSNTLLTNKEKKETYTLGIELGNLTQGKQMRWRLEKEEQINEVANLIYQEFKKFCLPYLEQYSNMEKAYSILLRDDKEGWIHCPIHVSRAMRAVALGKILRQDNLLDLIETKKSS